MGSVHSTTVGRDGSATVREATPPRRTITSRGGASRSADSDRSRSATPVKTAPIPMFRPDHSGISEFLGE